MPSKVDKNRLYGVVPIYFRLPWFCSGVVLFLVPAKTLTVAYHYLSLQALAANSLPCKTLASFRSIDLQAPHGTKRD